MRTTWICMSNSDDKKRTIGLYFEIVSRLFIGILTRRKPIHRHFKTFITCSFDNKDNKPITLIIVFDTGYYVIYLLIGCRHGLVMNISWKYGLQMANTILWACSNFPSQANVTSTKSPRSNKFWNPDAMFS